MSLKSYKPYTKSTRATVLVDRKSIWKGSPFKSLTKGKTSSGGRNNLGRITSRARGAGHKKRYRIIDFHRNKIDMSIDRSMLIQSCLVRVMKTRKKLDHNQLITQIPGLLINF